MKQIILILLLTIKLSAVIAQQYIHDKFLFTARDMNIKGKIKRVTEFETTSHSKEKLATTKQKMKYVYDFDEKGRLIKLEHFALLSTAIVIKTVKYDYLNNKIYKINTVGSSPASYTHLFKHSPTSIMVFQNESIYDIHTIKNKRVTEVKTFLTSDKTKYGFRSIYEYNSLGQIQKITFADDFGYNKYATWKNYKYNKQLDLETIEEYKSDGKLHWIHSYSYTYDRDKNWTKCIKSFNAPGADEDQATYTQNTRTYEYY